MANIQSTILTNDDSSEEKCPVCEHGNNPTPGDIPPYIDPPRIPMDNETLIGRENLERAGKGKRVKGANVYKRGKTLIHRDTFHPGKGAEIEVYNSTGKKHLGAICAHCGTEIEGKQDKMKKCDP